MDSIGEIEKDIPVLDEKGGTIMKSKSFLINLTIAVCLSGFSIFADQKLIEDDKYSQLTSIDTAMHHSNGERSVIIKTAEKQILFFINPNGRPCQIQLSILDLMTEKLRGIAEVIHVKTTEPGHRDKFYQYGVRALPTLIITDKNGKEIKRFPPGIQDEKTILAAINN